MKYERYICTRDNNGFKKGEQIFYDSESQTPMIPHKEDWLIILAPKFRMSRGYWKKIEGDNK